MTDFILDFIEKYKELFIKEFSDFCEINKSLDDKKAKKEVSMFCQAYEERLIGWLIFCYVNGIKDNLYHFKHPMNPSVNESDAELYLRESVVRQSLDFHRASEEMAEKRIGVSKDEYEVVSEYYIYLENLLPKIAHLKGFEEGDRILPLIEPGYVPDPFYTKIYRRKVSLWCELEL